MAPYGTLRKEKKADVMGITAIAGAAAKPVGMRETPSWQAFSVPPQRWPERAATHNADCDSPVRFFMSPGAQKGRAAAKALKERHPELDVITPAVPRITAREVTEDILHPVRRNDMKARRKKLRLSQSELATVFDVDVVSIYRRERDKVLPILWDYALKGVEAEAANPGAQQILRAFRSDQDRTNLIVPGGLEARGHRLVAVRMVGAMRDSVRIDRLKKKVQRTERETSKAVVVDLPKPRPSSGSPS